MEEKDEEKTLNALKKQAAQETQRNWTGDVDNIHVTNALKLGDNLSPIFRLMTRHIFRHGLEWWVQFTPKYEMIGRTTTGYVPVTKMQYGLQFKIEFIPINKITIVILYMQDVQINGMSWEATSLL